MRASPRASRALRAPLAPRDERSLTQVLRSRGAPLLRFVRRHRRIVASLLAGLAVLLIIGALRPPAAARTPVVVAATDLPAGRTLEREDVSLAEMAAAPPGARADVDDLIGETLTSPILAGEAVTTSRLLSHALDGADGQVVVPVRVSDPLITGLLEPGQVLDLVAPGGRVVARGVRLVMVPRAAGSLIGGQDRAGQVILVAAPAADAQRLAGASQDTLSPVLW